MEGAAGVVSQETAESTEAAADLAGVHAEIDEMTLEKDFLSGSLLEQVC